MSRGGVNMLKCKKVSVGVRVCDCAEATRILSCHISVHVLEEKKSRPPGWFVVQANPPHII